MDEEKRIIVLFASGKNNNIHNRRNRRRLDTSLGKFRRDEGYALPIVETGYLPGRHNSFAILSSCHPVPGLTLSVVRAHLARTFRDGQIASVSGGLPD